MFFDPHFKPSTEEGRKRMNALFYGDEGELLTEFIEYLSFTEKDRQAISQQAIYWVEGVRAQKHGSLDVQNILQAYPLSTPQGRAMMCLAESLLRIPDAHTAGLLIEEKVVGQGWKDLKKSEGTLVKLSATGLDVLSQYLKSGSIKKALSFAGDPVIRTAFRQAMKLMGQEFIVGETIEKALKRRGKNKQDRYSFDMLGEGARTWSMAERYKISYLNAIKALGIQSQDLPISQRDSVSIKLSAIHPRYHFAHYADVMDRLVPDLLELCQTARDAGVAVSIDAEEVARLDLSLDVMEKVFKHPTLKDWHGFGVVIQAYQKRAMGVIETVEAWARETQKPMIVRLVKGAYWDTEIKAAQEGGLDNYPLYTRKASTDISYLACAKRILEGKGILYPQFATHNAYTIAAVLQMAGERDDIEFQRLQGMGEDLYGVVKKDISLPVRIYAPVGTHENLLAYLVRRLLENGANSSFVNKIYDGDVSPQEVLSDPFVFFDAHTPGANSKIPLPQNLYGETRKNSRGLSLDFVPDVEVLKKSIESNSLPPYVAGPLVGEEKKTGDTLACFNPATGETIGKIVLADAQDLESALKMATISQSSWDLFGAQRRGHILRKASDLMEERTGLFLSLLIHEAGKTLKDAQSELREAVDFCRYYADQAEKLMRVPEILPGPSGELNQLQCCGRGVFACISPWNFPLAIFMGQVTAALATGNSVIAKPAMQTPLVGYEAIKVLHEAGVPQGVLHFLPGKGSILGDPLVRDHRIKGVVFTGSTETAQRIHKNLADRGGAIVPLIAETGGLNTMIVDSSALLEQVVDDVIVSAFQSAGQRCSALRLLIIQEDVADNLIALISEAMADLTLGDPRLLNTDIGPVIDDAARLDIENWVKKHKKSIVARAPHPLESGGYFVPPTLIELASISDLTREIFGPVLHVCRFKEGQLAQTVDAINALGFGLTMGLQTRLDTHIQLVRESARVGNLYVNRSMIGAVVGVQPFGGEGLSGTGPKAGGPHYLTRFVVERTFTENTMARGGNPELLSLVE